MHFLRKAYKEYGTLNCRIMAGLLAKSPMSLTRNLVIF